MDRKEFILILSKKYILPIILISILIYFGFLFYNEENKLEVIKGTFIYSGFAFAFFNFWMYQIII